MIKDLILLLILISFFAITNQISFGQENKNYSVTGVLMDLKSKQPIEFASVAIFKIPDTTLITGTITNAKGEFVINKLTPGMYLLKSSFIGFKTFSKNVEIINTSITLSEPIYLTTSTLSINEVEITTTRNEKQITI